MNPALGVFLLALFCIAAALTMIAYLTRAIWQRGWRILVAWHRRDLREQEEQAREADARLKAAEELDAWQCVEPASAPDTNEAHCAAPERPKAIEIHRGADETDT